MTETKLEELNKIANKLKDLKSHKARMEEKMKDIGDEVEDATLHLNDIELIDNIAVPERFLEHYMESLNEKIEALQIQFDNFEIGDEAPSEDDGMESPPDLKALILKMPTEFLPFLKSLKNPVQRKYAQGFCTQEHEEIGDVFDHANLAAAHFKYAMDLITRFPQTEYWSDMNEDFFHYLNAAMRDWPRGDNGIPIKGTITTTKYLTIYNPQHPDEE